ncbi:hypothetical protein [Pontibacter kalidii]|uniref:hypothetical protein n=1 Tax=Pontibacter kalidii TaxID=2592049 RepID=UPI00224DBF1F|nr:hypothetical protein [Pontibacter kalidii]
MKNVEDLKKEMRWGDLALIADISGVKKNTVDAIFLGKRNPDTPMGRKARAAAERLIDSRKLLMASSEDTEHGDTPSKDVA